MPASGVAGSKVGARRQLSSLYGLFVLSMMMFEARDEMDILRLSVTSVPSLGPLLVEAAYLIERGQLAAAVTPPTVEGIAEQIAAMDGGDGAITVPAREWGWAYPLRTRAGLHGYLVLSSHVQPSEDDRFLVRVLAQQTAVAMANATLYQNALATAAEVQALSDERARINTDLTRSVNDLAQQARAQEVLGQVSASGQREEGIASALHQLIGLPVAIEDQFGNITAWSAPDGIPPYPKKPATEHEAMLRDAGKAGGRTVRAGAHLIRVVRPGHEPLGTIVAVDPDRTAGAYELFAIQHASTALAVEWAHQRELAETKLRLRHELVDELVTDNGADVEDAFARAAAVGHDLSGPHQVVTVRWRGAIPDQALTRATEHALTQPGLRALVARRSGILVAIAPHPVDGAALYHAIGRELRSTTGTIGISGRANTPAELPHSLLDSIRALEIREKSHSPDGASDYAELGIYRLLGTGDTTREVEAFVHQWLGPLLEYDSRRNADLVTTLSRYLDCGGNYDQTAQALVIHRSTLRYRLHRIRDLTERDLSDVDTRFNLHVATRAWAILDDSS
ncbi:MAG TPA: helix-turn-helix domain-containing protein [Jatrophihabitantaceae bacterium]|jgi:sugar diacid utilization regulator